MTIVNRWDQWVKFLKKYMTEIRIKEDKGLNYNFPKKIKDQSKKKKKRWMTRLPHLFTKTKYWYM